MTIHDDLTRQGWHRVRPLADGATFGESEPTEAAYGIAVYADRGRILGATIWHRPGDGTSRPRWVQLDTVPTPEQAAGLHEVAGVSDAAAQ